MTKTDNKIEQLFKLGTHLGHKTNRIHPKAKKYIYTVQNGVSIIDLTKTINLLNKAKEYIKDLAKNEKTLLVVATKKLFSTQIFNLCQKNKIPVVSTKWPAGLLTNFDNIIRNVKKLEKMKEQKENGVWNQFVKHEQIKLKKQLNKLEKFYGGIINLKKIPDALFVIDAKKEKNAIIEAQKMSIPIIAVVDTNTDPTPIDFPIPANDDLFESVNYIAQEIITAYIFGIKSR